MLAKVCAQCSRPFTVSHGVNGRFKKVSAGAKPFASSRGVNVCFRCRNHFKKVSTDANEESGMQRSAVEGDSRGSSDLGTCGGLSRDVGEENDSNQEWSPSSLSSRKKEGNTADDSKKKDGGKARIARRSSKRVRSNTTFYSPPVNTFTPRKNTVGESSALIDDKAFRLRRIQLTVESGPLGIEISEVVRISNYKKQVAGDIRLTAKRGHCHPFISEQVPIGARLVRINGQTTHGCNYEDVALMLAERRPVSVEFEWEGTLLECKWLSNQPSRAPATRKLDDIIDLICARGNLDEDRKDGALFPLPSDIPDYTAIIGSVWSPEEILAFLALAVVYHSELSQIQTCLETKTLKEVVAFYHIWVTTKSFRSYWTKYGAARDQEDLQNRNGVYRANVESPTHTKTKGSSGRNGNHNRPEAYLACSHCGKSCKSEAGKANHERHCRTKQGSSDDEFGQKRRRVDTIADNEGIMRRFRKKSKRKRKRKNKKNKTKRLNEDQSQSQGQESASGEDS